MAITVILDIDGTLVDSNYHHALGWYRALRKHGHVVQIWQIHRHIGMGGDQLVTALVGEEVERVEGDSIREADAELFAELIDEVEPMDGARGLIEGLVDEGASVILSSSAKADEVDHYLELLDARELVDGWTTSEDVEQTKPEPDLIKAALAKADGDGPVLMIGDSVWDVKAASAAGLPTMAVLSGGFSEAELREAGAVEVAESIGELRLDRDSLERVAK